MAPSPMKSDATRRRVTVDVPPGNSGRQQERQRASPGASPSLDRAASLGPEHHVARQHHDNRAPPSVAFVNFRHGGTAWLDDSIITEDSGKEDESYHTLVTMMMMMVGGRSSAAVAPGDGDSVGRIGGVSEDESAGSSKMWDRIEESIKMTETMLLAEEKSIEQKRRKLFLRRCTRAVFGLVALATLSWSVGYLVSERGDDSVFGSLLKNNSLDQLFDNNHPEEPKDGKLPRRAERTNIGERGLISQEYEQGHKMMIPPDLSEEDLPGKDRSDDRMSFRERKSGKRARRILERERRIRIRARQDVQQSAPR